MLLFRNSSISKRPGDVNKTNHIKDDLLLIDSENSEMSEYFEMNKARAA